MIKALFHTALVIFTGGLWGLVLIVRALVK